MKEQITYDIFDKVDIRVGTVISVQKNENFYGERQKYTKIETLDKLYNDKVIQDHGMEVAKELAYVLSGGDTSIDKQLSEDDLFKLELGAFMKLIETPKTQERIKHTLATGKPLVN